MAGVVALGLAPAVIGALSGFSVGTTQTAAANILSNVLPEVEARPWHAGVVQSAFVGAMGGAAAGGIVGALKPQSLAARMAVGGLVGGGVSGGTQVAINVATGRPWDEGLGQALSVGLTTGTLDAFMDYYGGRLMDRQLGKRPVRGLAEDTDRGPWKPSLREFAGRLLADEMGGFRLGPADDDVIAARLRNLDEFTGEPTGLRGDELRRALSDAGGGRGGLSGRLVEAQADDLLPVRWNAGTKRWHAAIDFEFNGRVYRRGQIVPTELGQYAPRRPGLPPRADLGWQKGQLADAEFEALRQMAMQRGKRIVLSGSLAETDIGLLRRYFAKELGYEVPESESWRFRRSHSGLVEKGVGDIDPWEGSNLTPGELAKLRSIFPEDFKLDLPTKGYNRQKYPNLGDFGPSRHNAGALVFEPDGRVWRVPAARQSTGRGSYNAGPLLLESPAMKRARELGVPTGGYSNTRYLESWPPRSQVGEPIQDMLDRRDFAEPGGILAESLSGPELAELACALEDVPRVPHEFGELILVSRYNYVIDVNGTVLVFRSDHHSDLVRGANVLGGGEIYIDIAGNVRFINNRSGHYLPGPEFEGYLIELLNEQGISTQGTRFQFQ